jgi:hypothetical protein
MKKFATFFFLLSIVILQVYGQHSVNDIKRHKGWYKITIEMDSHDTSIYTVTQCYPNGDEYPLNDNERRQLPLWVKVFCIGIFEEGLKGQMEMMTFDEDGIHMGLRGFTLIIDSSKSDEEILASLGQEMVDKYEHKKW